jgi:nucleoside-diphosphate-sugar epimerase
MNEILITGSRGFIGTAIRNALKHPYDEVDLKIGSHHSCISGKKGTLIHLSAWVQQNESFKYPVKYIENNLRDLAFLIEKNSFDQIIFPSTSCVYDRYGNLEPVSPYGLSKLAAEKLIRIYFKQAWILRFMNPYGEHDDRSIFYLLSQCKKHNRTFQIFTSQKVVRDYFYVGHIASIINEILDGNLKCGTYNVGSGIGTEVAPLMGSICDQHGINYEHVESPEGLLDGYIPTENIIKAEYKDLIQEWERYYLGDTNESTIYRNRYNVVRGEVSSPVLSEAL